MIVRDRSPPMSVRTNAVFVMNKTIASAMSVFVSPGLRAKIEAYAKARNVARSTAIRELITAGLKAVKVAKRI